MRHALTLPLDLERFMVVATSDFNMGAMENKGLNIFNTKYVPGQSRHCHGYRITPI
jgi:aminopeptidase N